ncbi:MAG: hypothetical protein M5U34_44415 [Chloroflexi bacterium]|nr:hypothetical protein [Chloroflexota bacterium]
MSNKEYLTVAEALQIVLAGVSVLPAEETPILEALGRVLAQPVVAADSLPPVCQLLDGWLCPASG